MMNRLKEFRNFLLEDEKSKATIEKYTRDIHRFCIFINGEEISKTSVIEYKKYLQEQGFAVRSINSMLASVNSYLDFIGHQECKVKHLRTQNRVYCNEDRELTRNDYMKLLKAAEGNLRLQLILQTICGTGIRISELQYFTVEAVHEGEINVTCKNKIRTVIIPGKLRKMLLRYVRRNKIAEGYIFRTKIGKPMNRSCIWREMKRLCGKAGVLMSKVFPHNLRKLFAKTYYKVEKDIAKLADILGHSSINTTRIYIMTSGGEHRKQIEKLGLVVGDVRGKCAEIKITT